MRKAVPGLQSVALLLCASVVAADLPELGGVYLGAAYTTVTSTFPETQNDLLPGPRRTVSYAIPHASLQYDRENSWLEWKITSLYWDWAANLTYASNTNIGHILLTDGLLGHFVYGRNYLRTGRARVGFGLGIGEYAIDTEALEAGYYLTLDLATKADVLLTEALVGRLVVRYDVPIGSVTDPENNATRKKKRPHFLDIDLMLISSSRWYVGLEYLRILPRNGEEAKAAHFRRRVEHMFQSRDPVAPVDLEASRLFLHAGLKFHSVDSW